MAYHPCHVRKLLGRLGWSFQKPERWALQRDDAAIVHWKRSRWPHIKNAARRGPIWSSSMNPASSSFPTWPAPGIRKAAPRSFAITSSRTVSRRSVRWPCLPSGDGWPSISRFVLAISRGWVLPLLLGRRQRMIPKPSCFRVHDEYDERRVENEMDREATDHGEIGLLNLGSVNTNASPRRR